MSRHDGTELDRARADAERAGKLLATRIEQGDAAAVALTAELLAAGALSRPAPDVVPATGWRDSWPLLMGAIVAALLIVVVLVLWQ